MVCLFPVMSLSHLSLAVFPFLDIPGVVYV